jgi:hypothetical protein
MGSVPVANLDLMNYGNLVSRRAFANLPGPIHHCLGIPMIAEMSPIEGMV